MPLSELGALSEDRPAAVERIVRGWATMTPPIRPSVEDLARFEGALVDAALPADAHVLLLGSTPELRGLVLKYGYRLTGCDVDELFWEAMSQLQPVEGEEFFVHSDWLDLPEDHAYDLVVGDRSLNMLTWERICAMVPKLGGLLGGGRRAILGIQTTNPTLSQSMLAEAIAGYPGPRRDRAFVISIHCMAESLRCTEHPEMTRREYYESVVSQYLTPQEMESLRPLLRDKRNCYPSMDALQALLLENFEILCQEPCPGLGAWGTAHLFTLGETLHGNR